jgi:hypothetical protein
MDEEDVDEDTMEEIQSQYKQPWICLNLFLHIYASANSLD